MTALARLVRHAGLLTAIEADLVRAVAERPERARCAFCERLVRDLTRKYEAEMYTSREHIEAQVATAHLSRFITEIVEEQTRGGEPPDRKTAEASARERLEALRNSEAYTAWVETQVEEAARDGDLLTSQQFRDLAAKPRRWLEPGDRVRYVGPARDEDTPLGRVRRETGQMGRIIGRRGEEPGAREVVFEPDRPKGRAHDPNITVRVVQLVVREGTEAYFELERVV